MSAYRRWRGFGYYRDQYVWLHVFFPCGSLAIFDRSTESGRPETLLAIGRNLRVEWMHHGEVLAFDTSGSAATEKESS